MRRTASACVVMVLAVWMSGAAEAQEVTASLEELVRNRDLRIGDGVYVTDATGQRIKGDVSNLSGTTLEIRAGNRKRTLQADSIQRIERQDSLESGIWLGLGIAFAGLQVSCRLEARVVGDFCYGTAYSFLPVMAGSAFLGAMIDASRHRTVYQASGSRRLTWAPTVSRRHLGLRASVEW